MTTRPEAATPPQAEPGQPRGCTNLKLRRLTRQVSRLYDAQMADCAMKTTQYSLLVCVERLGPAQPGVLARALSMDASTLTRNLRPLIDAGWVRVGAGRDARSRLVQITEAGRAKRAQARAQWRRAQHEIERLLGRRRVAALHAMIDEIAALLDAAAGEERETAR